MDSAALSFLTPLLDGVDRWGELLPLLPVLVALELILSADNAIALAAIARAQRDHCVSVDSQPGHWIGLRAQDCFDLDGAVDFGFQADSTVCRCLLGVAVHQPSALQNGRLW